MTFSPLLLYKGLVNSFQLSQLAAALLSSGFYSDSNMGIVSNSLPMPFLTSVFSCSICKPSMLVLGRGQGSISCSPTDRGLKFFLSTGEYNCFPLQGSSIHYQFMKTCEPSVASPHPILNVLLPFNYTSFLGMSNFMGCWGTQNPTHYGDSRSQQDIMSHS